MTLLLRCPSRKKEVLTLRSCTSFYTSVLEIFILYFSYINPKKESMDCIKSSKYSGRSFKDKNPEAKISI